MSIVDPSVLELLNHAESRYTLVVEASKRGREIVNDNLELAFDQLVAIVRAEKQNTVRYFPVIED